MNNSNVNTNFVSDVSVTTNNQENKENNMENTNQPELSVIELKNTNVNSNVSEDEVKSEDNKEDKEMENKVIQTNGINSTPDDLVKGFVINDKRVIFEDSEDFFEFFNELDFDLITDDKYNVIISPIDVYGLKENGHFENLFEYFECFPFINNNWLEVFDKYPLRIYKLKEIKLVNSYITNN